MWKLLHNEDRSIWIAYNTDTLTCHLICDKNQLNGIGVWDPDPIIPQAVIEKFHVELYGTELYYTN